jgi:glutathione S-transferase
MGRPVLWQFRFSHFNEKARWALDHKRVPHVRRSLLPGFHMPRLLWMTRQKQVPVLVVDGRATNDSTRIIALLERLWPEPALYPADDALRRRALALEEHFDEELGPHIRRALFHDVLPHTEAAVAIMTVGCGGGSRLLYRALFPVIRRLMQMDMRIDEAGARLGREKILAALDRIEAELQPSGYLAGDRFSVADLTAAALLSPLVLPREFPYRPAVALPDPARSFREALAGRPAFRWVEEIYRRHRGTSAEVPA